MISVFEYLPPKSYICSFSYFGGKNLFSYNFPATLHLLQWLSNNPYLLISLHRRIKHIYNKMFPKPLLNSTCYWKKWAFLHGRGGRWSRDMNEYVLEIFLGLAMAFWWTVVMCYYCFILHFFAEEIEILLTLAYYVSIDRYK